MNRPDQAVSCSTLLALPPPTSRHVVLDITGANLLARRPSNVNAANKVFRHTWTPPTAEHFCHVAQSPQPPDPKRRPPHVSCTAIAAAPCTLEPLSNICVRVWIGCGQGSLCSLSLSSSPSPVRENQRRSERPGMGRMQLVSLHTTRINGSMATLVVGWTGRMGSW